LPMFFLLSQLASSSAAGIRDQRLGGAHVQGETYLRHIGASFDEWKRMLAAHLTQQDRDNFAAVTGLSLEKVLLDPQWNTLDAGDWQDIMGTADRLIHPLNSKGLQVLRALLAERVIDYLRKQHQEKRSLNQLTSARKTSLQKMKKVLEIFQRDGILVMPLKAHSRSLDKTKPNVIDILKTISGYASVQTRRFKNWKVHRHIEHDEQSYLHVDTFFPTWKVWLFPPNIGMSAGPFLYVKGSHRNTPAKMAWWFNRSRACVPGFVKYRNGKKQVPITGPFDDALHGACGGAMRIQGFDPASPDALSVAPRLLAPFRFDPTPRPTPITTDASPVLTLVIADTSGFHARGFARPGALRNASRIDGGGGGCGGCIPRKCWAYCEATPGQSC